MAHATANLGTRTATSTAWMAGQTAITRVVGFLAQLVLTWLLRPEDFGLLGLVFTITAFASQLTDPGIDDVLLQRRAHLRRWATPAFWMSLTCSLMGAAAMILIAATVVIAAQHLHKHAYGDVRIVQMIAIMAMTAPLTALGLVPLTKLKSEMRFARLAAIFLVEFASMQILTIALAAMEMGAFSFVIPMPIVAAGRTAVFWYTARPHVRLRLELHRWFSLINSTGWVFAQRMLQSLVNQGDYMFLGAFFDDQAMVGRYYFAYMLSVQMIRVVGENLSVALTPALNTLHKDIARMQNAAIRASRAVAAILIPLGILQILLAGPMVRLLFATKWEPAIPLVRFLGFGPLLLGAAWPMQSIIIATGRFRAGFFLRLSSAICFVLVVGPLTWKWREVGTAIGVSIWAWLTAAIIFIFTVASWRGIFVLFHVVAKPVIASLPGAILGAMIVYRASTSIAGDLLVGSAATILFLGSYAMMMRQIDREMVRSLIGQFQAVVMAMYGMFIRSVERPQES